MKGPMTTQSLRGLKGNGPMHWRGDRTGVNPAQNRFGTDGTMAIEGAGVDEDFKIPHLRNMYQKVGMFAENTQTTSPVLGDQIRGFGYDNSGASGTISVFLSAPVFTLNATQRSQVEQFVLAMSSEMTPIVGQQVTVTPANVTQSDVTSRVNLLVQRALVTSPRPECELVARATIQNVAKGWVMNSGQSFVPNAASEAALTLQGLLNQVTSAGTPVTFTCAPPGNGSRIGVDRDSDNVLDRDET